jgi:RHS repeat-associated protein
MSLVLELSLPESTIGVDAGLARTAKRASRTCSTNEDCGMSESCTRTKYLYDAKNLVANVIEEVDNNGNVLARYTQDLGIDKPFAQLRSGATSYYEQDGLGSVTSLSNSAASLTNTYKYDSLGNLAASTGNLVNPFQYTGREFDPETGIYEYRARYYDPSIGRFVSEDPIRFKGGVDFYAYVRNNPVNLADPNGLQDSATNAHELCDRDPDQSERCKCHCNLLPIGDTSECEKLCMNCFSKSKSPKEKCLCLCNLWELPNCDCKCKGAK